MTTSYFRFIPSKFSELLLRCCVEIEAIAKQLFLNHGGVESERDLYFDTDCLQKLEDYWLLSKKKLIISAPNFYFENEENKILTPLYKANKRGSSSCDWKRAYQAIKHNRTGNLKNGNLKNLIRALGALFILNVYYKDDVYKLKRDSHATSFPTNLGSGIFDIKVHKWFGYDGSFIYLKRNDFCECIYLTRYTEESLERNKKASTELKSAQQNLFYNHRKFAEYMLNNKLEDYKGKNLMWDVLGKDEYIRILNEASKKPLQIMKETDYEAILNKNDI